MLRIPLISLIMLALAGPVMAAQTVRLPAARCQAGSLFGDGFDTPLPANPSRGSGGAYPGSRARSIAVAGFGTQTYYLYIPAGYAPARAMPLMVVLEGAAGSHAGALSEAQLLRDDWRPAADDYGFMVAVPVSNGGNGGWLAADGSGQPNDYDVIAAMLADVEQAYNIERSRVSVWGFSAGAFIAWDMALNNGLYVRPTPLNGANLASLSSAAGNSQFACSFGPTGCDARFLAWGRKLPVSIHIGNADSNYPGAYDDYQRLLGLGWVSGDTLAYHVFVGGHTFEPAQLQQVAAFACGFAVGP